MKRKLLFITIVILCWGVDFQVIGASNDKVALVIGNGAYRSSPLKNPVNDASDVSVVLKKIGFEVILRTDADKRVIA